MSQIRSRTGTTSRPRRVLDLFCKAGGAGYGYYLAGCEVTGVDIEPQPRYPFRFIQADAMTFPLDGYDLIHASPPCQVYSETAKVTTREHPDLVGPVRERLIESGIPYVIENVVGAPLIDPIMLCGAMFGLRVYRHRLFETSFTIDRPAHPDHYWQQVKMGRKPAPDQFHVPVGNFPETERARQDMSISWMTGKELAQAIPPAFTRYLAESGGSRQCVMCQRWWSPKRSHARTCSPACRKALSRRTSSV